MVKHIPMAPAEVNRLKAALEMNALGNDGAALMMAEDTSFVGTMPALPMDAEVISAVRAVPCHY